ncbi:MAG: cupin domain-containing protein [Mojavia pulchra JT2-VF2]|jgi:mannose-6-phosphate isomerase-like protein (cupin superfamily)|uniref:Cupin domain-containing protein n=1 Tax=Mojavia pulchra JT2-VF2 TaxID=287848 RepID=A0A951Q6B0_9NOST|nr:cupin domain-containing protein [Mojavia pulchra JT2-VF2]
MTNNKVVFGNAAVEGANRWGWFLGHFITPVDDLRSTEVLEVKWGVHKAGDSRTQWAVNDQAATLSILINGQFRLQFEEQEIVLAREGDYVLWSAGVPHYWIAESDCTILTVRWPSKSGDSVAVSS